MQRGRLLGALALFAALTALGSVGLAGKKPPKDPPPADPAIAFYERGSRLVVMNDDGSAKTVVLEDAGDLGRPTWSPDGQQLAFSSDLQGPGIYVVNVDGSGLRKVVAKNLVMPNIVDWSPVPAADGEYKLAFSDYATPNPNGTTDTMEVFLVNLDGTGLVNLTDSSGIWEMYVSWSPDADRLCVVQDGPDIVGRDLVVHELDVVDGSLAITETSSITSAGPLSETDLAFPSWAKTGDHIVMTAYGDSGSDLWVIDLADPTDPANVTSTSDVGERFPSFSPDDTEIAFLRLPSNREGIHVMPADGSGAPTRIYKGRSIGPLAWRRNP
jgi:Tol biopolymer transport system component